MRIHYDPQADALYVELCTRTVADSQEIDEYVYVDFDEQGVPVGIEILFTSQFMAPADLTSVTINIAQPVEGLLGP
jgi:uncharacterized protein YuzE